MTNNILHIIKLLNAKNFCFAYSLSCFDVETWNLLVWTTDVCLALLFLLVALVMVEIRDASGASNCLVNLRTMMFKQRDSQILLNTHAFM